MKIVTANGKKTVKMSKSEWLHIGNKAGWTKKAQVAPQAAPAQQNAPAGAAPTQQQAAPAQAKPGQKVVCDSCGQEAPWNKVTQGTYKCPCGKGKGFKRA